MQIPGNRARQRVSNRSPEDRLYGLAGRPEGQDGERPASASLGRYCFLLIGLFLAGCSAHSPFILKNTTDSTPVQNTFPANQDKVFITSQALPASSYVSVSRIDVGKIWYGSTDGVLDSLADRARQLGANAVIETKTWHQPSGFAWAAPEGSGLAVRVADIKSLETSGVQGSWH
jgi:hypothetical protein